MEKSSSPFSGRGTMKTTNAFVDYCVDQLAPLGPVVSRRMFGGAGLYLDGQFFALVADDVLYFKVDDSNRQDFLDAGSEAFRPFPDKPSMSYFAVPEGVLDDSDEVAGWAAKAVVVARRAAKRKPVLRQRRR